MPDYGYRVLSPSGDALITMATRHDAIGLVAVLSRGLETTGDVEAVPVADPDLAIMSNTRRQEAI